MISLAVSDELVRLTRFGVVGIFNTLLDFAIFNALSGKTVGLSKIKANTISTTVAMIFSFYINRNYVFYGQGNEFAQAAMFFGVTAFGLYILQNGVIYLLTDRMKWPRLLADKFTKSHRIPFDSDFVLKNSAKIIGTFVSLAWNYVLYGKVVFRGKS